MGTALLDESWSDHGEPPRQQDTISERIEWIFPTMASYDWGTHWWPAIPGNNPSNFLVRAQQYVLDSGVYNNRALRIVAHVLVKLRRWGKGRPSDDVHSTHS